MASVKPLDGSGHQVAALSTVAAATTDTPTVSSLTSAASGTSLTSAQSDGTSLTSAQSEHSSTSTASDKSSSLTHSSPMTTPPSTSASTSAEDSSAVMPSPPPPARMPPPPPALLNGSPEPRYRRENSDSPPAEPPPPPPPDDATNQRGDQTNHNATDGAALSGGLSDLSIGDVQIEYSNYCSELQMPEIMQLIQRDLSEPYSIYTYRYFINNWPNLCFLARHRGRIVGAIVCKLDSHDSHTKRVVTSRGYIAMLAVDQRYRKQRIGSRLVLNAIRAMAADAADEVVLETEVTNTGALRLYENLGFVRDKRLFRYYLNGVDALRLKLWLWPP